MHRLGVHMFRGLGCIRLHLHGLVFDETALLDERLVVLSCRLIILVLNWLVKVAPRAAHETLFAVLYYHLGAGVELWTSVRLVLGARMRNLNRVVTKR